MERKVQNMHFIITGFGQICTNGFWFLFYCKYNFIAFLQYYFPIKCLKYAQKNDKICIMYINPGTIHNNGEGEPDSLFKGRARKCLISGPGLEWPM